MNNADLSLERVDERLKKNQNGNNPTSLQYIKYSRRQLQQ